MRTRTVQASLDKFLADCTAAGLSTIEVKMDGENWVKGFTTIPF
jgi:hypothetical protein